MNSWQPISADDFLELFRDQYNCLSDAERMCFDRFRVEPWKAKLRRSGADSVDDVFVVAQSDDGVLYFDDVEYGFNISTVDDFGNILFPGGSQNTLQEAVIEWFPVT